MINKQPHPHITGIENVCEFRTLTFTLRDWAVQIDSVEMQTWDNGERILELNDSPTLNIVITGGKNHYKGSITPFRRDPLRYAAGEFYKVNAQRNKAVDTVVIRPLLDEIFDYWRSYEGQQLMIEQTLKKISEEKKELMARVDLLIEYQKRLFKESKALADPY